MLLTTLLAQTSGDVAAGTAGTAVAGVMILIWVLILGLGLIGLILWIWALIDLLKRNFQNPSDKTTWLIVLIVGIVIGLHWLAAIIYLIAGRKKGTMPGSSGGAETTSNPNA